MEDRYADAVERFYKIYRELQEKYDLHMHSAFSVYEDGLIEVWEYIGRKKERCICKIMDEEDTACYERAAQELELYREKGEHIHVRKAG